MAQNNSKAPFDASLGGNHKESEKSSQGSLPSDDAVEGDVNWGDAVEGGTIIGVGAGKTGFGLGLAAIGIGELTVGSPTIVGVFAGFHELIMGVGITGAEVVIMEKGVEKLAKSGILPAFNPINPR